MSLIVTSIWSVLWLLSGLWLLYMLTVTPGNSAAEYSVRELAVLPGASARNLGAFNVQNQLVGGAIAADSVQRAFLATEAGVQIIPVNARADHAAARGINDLGEIVGASNSAGAIRAFRWSATSGVQDLAPFGDDSSSEAYSVNRNGDAVGISSGRNGMRAVRWTPGGAVERLAGVPEDAYSRALAISNQGAVVGSIGRPPAMRAFVWTASEVQELALLPGDRQSEALAINDAGDVVGWSRGPQGTRAVLWSSGKIQDLGAPYENATFTRARAINVRGEVVGGSIAAHQSRAFIWTRQRGMRDLNVLIPDSFPYLLSEAVAINNRGHIIAVGHGTDYRHDADDQGGPSLRIFILIPGRSRSTPPIDARRMVRKPGYDYCGLPLPVASPATLVPSKLSGSEWETPGIL